MRLAFLVGYATARWRHQLKNEGNSYYRLITLTRCCQRLNLPTNQLKARNLADQLRQNNCFKFTCTLLELAIPLVQGLGTLQDPESLAY
jgi:hypothetical protein